MIIWYGGTPTVDIGYEALLARQQTTLIEPYGLKNDSTDPVDGLNLFGCNASTTYEPVVERSKRSKDGIEWLAPHSEIACGCLAVAGMLLFFGWELYCSELRK
jgi:hypothetical protein